MVKVILVLFIPILFSCTKNNDPNYLFLVFEKLNSKAIYCNSDDTPHLRSGFQIICDEFHKFTHVYTPSLQSLPALGSFLSGLYPYQNQLRYNSFNHLAPEFKTFVESAKNNFRYKTYFYSSGFPFFRKSGVHQGFGVFDDHIPSDKEFRSIKENIQLFIDQITEEKNSKFISVLTFSDLKYPFKVTTNDLGEIRNLSYESQLEEIDEKLYFLFESLKKEKLWEKTKVFIVGLNGKTNANLENEYDNDFAPLNLKSSNTQVAFYFKDIKLNSINEKPIVINNYLSLKDIGHLLNETFKLPSNTSNSISVAKHIAADMIKSFKSENPNYIVIESSWAKTHDVGEIRSAIVNEENLFIFDQNKLLFNKLTDSLELYPQPISSANEDDFLKYENFLKERKFSPFVKNKSIRKLIKEIEDIKSGVYTFSSKSELMNFFSILNAIEKKESHFLNSFFKNNLHGLNESCLGYVIPPKISKNHMRKCKDPLFELFVEYIFNNKNMEKETKMKAISEINYFQIKKNFYKNNLKTDLNYIPYSYFKENKILSYVPLSINP